MTTFKEITDRIKRADMESEYNAITAESLAYKLLSELPITRTDDNFSPVTMDFDVFIDALQLVMNARQFQHMERIYNGQEILLQALSSFKITTEEDMSKLWKLYGHTQTYTVQQSRSL
jgi:hypothetical protein